MDLRRDCSAPHAVTRRVLGARGRPYDPAKPRVAGSTHAALPLGHLVDPASGPFATLAIECVTFGSRAGSVPSCVGPPRQTRQLSRAQLPGQPSAPLRETTPVLTSRGSSSEALGFCCAVPSQHGPKQTPRLP
jgi:hypothetical protein